MTQRRTTTKTRAAAVGLAMMATLGLVGMTAGAAQAQEVPTASAKTTAAAAGEAYGYFTASGVNIRTGPSTGNTILGQGQNGQPITVHCKANPWWYITNQATGVTGWVYWPDNVLVANQSPNPPVC